jgi:hypothetical protein
MSLKEGINALPVVSLMCICPWASWLLVGTSTLCQEHGHQLVCTWKVVVACGHMHGLHATTESTQGHNTLKTSRIFIGQGGEAGGRQQGGLLLGCCCHVNVVLAEAQQRLPCQIRSQSTWPEHSLGIADDIK